MLEPQSVAEVLLARMLHTQERGWLPATKSQITWWWCWSQDAPDAPILPCPYPLPANLASHTLLWTPWLGATWDGLEPSNGSWLVVPGRGCIRFRGEPRGYALKDVLLLWGSDFALSPSQRLLFEDQLLEQTLHRLAVERLPFLS